MRKRFKKTITALSLFLMPLFLVSCLTVATAFKGNLRSNTTYADVFQASIQSAGEANFKVVSNDIKTGLIVAEQARESFNTTYFRMNITVKKMEHGTSVDVSIEPPQDVVGDTKAMFNNFAKALKNKVPDVTIVSQSLQAEKDQKQASKPQKNQIESTRIFNKPYDAVWSATIKTLASKGYSISSQDNNTGTIFTGYYSLGTEQRILSHSVDKRCKLNILLEKKTDSTSEVTITTTYEESSLGLEREIWSVKKSRERPSDLINLEKDILDTIQIKL